ncbi:MAG: hypothetical protein IKQ83_02860 [Lachnospiraceae bacterium]|nr:hypothetical protein [Lachnospiraceae bacterium]
MISFDMMNIPGLIVVLALPYMAGYILKTVTLRREIGQIETYLTGFFFLFLIQGAVFVTADSFMGLAFAGLCDCYVGMIIAVAAVFAVTVIINIILNKKRGREERYRQKLTKREWILISLMFLIGILVCIRVVGTIGYVREDFMFPTVKTTLATGTVNAYNPITSRPYVYGIINSRKVITLPIYYACTCAVFKMDPILLLYVICTIQTVICTYFSCVLFIIPIIRFRERLYMFGIFLGALLLSGDYFNYAIGGKLLWNGYAGDTIVAAVMLPYVLFLIMSGYRERRLKIIDSLKLFLVFFSSVFITGVAKGALLICITGGIAFICCIIIGRKGAAPEDRTLIVGE